MKCIRIIIALLYFMLGVTPFLQAQEPASGEQLQDGDNTITDDDDSYNFKSPTLYDLYKDSTSAPIEKIEQLMGYSENDDIPREALELFKSLKSGVDHLGEYYMYQGYFEMTLEEFSDASDSFEKAIDLLSDNEYISTTHYFLGNIQMQQELHAMAFYNFKKSYRADSSNIMTILILGDIYTTLEEFKEAIYYFEKAVSLHPNLREVRSSIGYLYAQLEDYEKAKKVLDEVIAEYPDFGIPYNNRGYVYLKLGQTKEALKDVQKSIELEPDNSYAYKNRALIYFEKKDKAKACKDLEEALNLGFAEKYGDEVSQLRKQFCEE